MFKILQIISMLSVLPASLISILNWQHFHIKTIRIIGLLCIFYALSEAIFYITSIYAVKNVVLYGIYSCIELVIILAYYSQNHSSKFLRPYYAIIALALILFIGISIFERPNEYPAIARGVQSTFLVLVSIFHLVKWFMNEKDFAYNFIIRFAFFLYFGMSSVTFFLTNELDTEMLKMFWFVHHTFNFVTKGLITFCLINYLWMRKYI